MRETRTLRATWRGLETWHGRDPRPGPARQSSTLPMSGMWRRSHARTSEAPPDERGGYRYVRPTVTAPHLDSTTSEPCASAFVTSVVRPAAVICVAPCVLGCTSGDASLWRFSPVKVARAFPCLSDQLRRDGEIILRVRARYLQPQPRRALGNHRKAECNDVHAAFHEQLRHPHGSRRIADHQHHDRRPAILN